MNKCLFIGRLGRDPEPLGQSGAMKFSLAVDGWDSQAKAKTTDWIPCIAFGKTADTVRNYLTKGRQVAVMGKFKTRERIDPTTNQKRWDTSILIDDLELLADGSGQKAQQQGAPAPAASGNGNEFGW